MGCKFDEVEDFGAPSVCRNLPYPLIEIRRIGLVLKFSKEASSRNFGRVRSRSGRRPIGGR